MTEKIYGKSQYHPYGKFLDLFTLPLTNPFNCTKTLPNSQNYDKELYLSAGEWTLRNLLSLSSDSEFPASWKSNESEKNPSIRLWTSSHSNFLLPLLYWMEEGMCSSYYWSQQALGGFGQPLYGPIFCNKLFLAG